MKSEIVLPLPCFNTKIATMVYASVIAGFLGGYEWIVIVLAIVLLFGGRKIPELMRGLGKGIREFKESTKGIEESADSASDEKKKD